MNDDFLKPYHGHLQKRVNALLDEAGPERTANHILGLLRESGIMTLRDIAAALRINDRELYAALHLLDKELVHYRFVDGEMEEIA